MVLYRLAIGVLLPCIRSLLKANNAGATLSPEHPTLGHFQQNLYTYLSVAPINFLGMVLNIISWCQGRLEWQNKRCCNNYRSHHLIVWEYTFHDCRPPPWARPVTGKYNLLKLKLHMTYQASPPTPAMQQTPALWLLSWEFWSQKSIKAKGSLSCAWPPEQGAQVGWGHAKQWLDHQATCQRTVNPITCVRSLLSSWCV